MLIESHRHTVEDLRLWREYQEADSAHAKSQRLRDLTAVSLNALIEFCLDQPPCYCGVSWGKDSVVVAHLLQCAFPNVPLVWIRVEPIKNPDCERVRDAFLSLYPRVAYREITRDCEVSNGEWHASGTLEAGVKECEERFGRRHILGIRGDESTGRAIRVSRWGLCSPHACAPLGRWSVQDVMSYLWLNDLPVHPAYAMLGGGRYPRERLRVASLGGRRGDGLGRAEWEREYYGDVLNKLEHDAHAARSN